MDLASLRPALLILLGAVCSWLIGQILPNARRKKELGSRLADLSAQTAELSGRIDPLLAVLLRTERLRLQGQRRNLNPIQPSFRAYADVIDSRMQSLSKRVSVARQLDRATLARDSWAEGPVSLGRLGEVDARLREIVLLLTQRDAPDGELDEAAARLAKLAAAMAADAEPVDTAGRLRAGFDSLRAYFLGSSPAGEAAEAAACLPSLFEAIHAQDDNRARLLFEQWLRGVGEPRAEIQLAGAEAVRSYDLLLKGGAPFGEDRMGKIHDELLLGLKLPSLDGALRLRRLVRQCAQGIFVEDVEGEIRAGRVAIALDPPKVYTDRLIRFSIRFTRAEINGAAALEAFQCVWTLPDGEGGTVRLTGWETARYFRTATEHSVRAEFLSANGHSIEGAALEVAVAPTTQPGGDRISPQGWLELAQFLIALVIPILAMSSSASNAEPWSLFVLGFTSDKIKEAIAGSGMARSA
jgi:hypothetical protein